jgi:hypothetical protein
VAKNDTFIEQVRYENTTYKSNKSIHLELLTPTYAKVAAMSRLGLLPTYTIPGRTDLPVKCYASCIPAKVESYIIRFPLTA